MIGKLKTLIACYWPVMRLRTVLLGTLLFVAALPGISAIFLRVYENALVRRTEAELVAQSAALAAAATAHWRLVDPRVAAAPDPVPPVPAAATRRMDRSTSYVTSSRDWANSPTEIDLRSSDILAPRPPAVAATNAPDQMASQVAEHLLPAFKETQLTTLSSIIMLDENGTVLTGSEAGLSLAKLPEITSARAGQPVTLIRINSDYGSSYPFEWLSRASNIRLHHARPIMVAGEVKAVLLVSRSPRALFKGMYEDRGKILLGIAGIFVLLIVLSALLARAIVRPIENLSKATHALASGKQARLVRPSLQVVEIRDLIGDFEVMAERIDKRSRYLRDFASSVSHEFKTPLAAISGAIELLQDHTEDMEPADRERFLANMASDAERLSRLVGRLMELAQADLQMEGAKERTDLASLVATVADSLRQKGFAIELDIAYDIALLEIGSDALEAVLVTLTENARQAGAATLAVSARLAGQVVQIDLSDDGSGVPKADRTNIFDPFFTSKRDSGGTGLGLSIARSLLEAYRGSLELVPSGEGAHFRITIPHG